MTKGCASPRADPLSGKTSVPAPRARMAASRRLSARMAGQRLWREGRLGAGGVIEDRVERPGRLEMMTRQIGRDAAAGLERAAQAREERAIAGLPRDGQRLLRH